MIILSWDIGISNLAWCLMTYDSDTRKYDIFDWNVINFMDPDDNKRIVSCQGIVRSGSKKDTMCGKTAFYINPDGTAYCKRHDPDKENHREQLEEDRKEAKKRRKKKGKYSKYRNIPLQVLAGSLTKRLDDENILDKKPIDVVLIESQPKLASAAVKHVMDFLLCYLTIRSIDKGLRPKIITISARRKLSVYTGPFVKCTIKDAHSRNKFLGVAYCRYMLEEDLTNAPEEPFVVTPDWQSFFESIKKKDDIADAFLQGAWYLKNNNS